MISDAVDRAVTDGKISPGRAAVWRSALERDPGTVGALLASMAPGVIPFTVPIERCMRCNGDEWQTLQSGYGEIGRRCGACGFPGRAGIFRRWDGPVVHVFNVPGGVVDVWCGPPAPLPEQPSPADILRACGIDPETVFCE